jgi:hypothetical protein
MAAAEASLKSVATRICFRRIMTALSVMTTMGAIRMLIGKHT